VPRLPQLRHHLGLQLIRRFVFTSDPSVDAATIKAGRTWELQRDLPHVGALAEFRACAEATAEVATRRLRSGEIDNSEAIVVPKFGGGERLFTSAAPLDEVVLRGMAADATVALKERMPHESVAYRVARSGAGWRVRDRNASIRERQKRAYALVADRDFRGLGLTDVRNYYPSIRRDLCVEALISVGSSAAAAEDLVDRLWGVASTAGTPGLPIGPEVSGLLGVAALAPLDIAIREMVPHLRTTDDVWSFHSSRSVDWPDYIDSVIGMFAARDLEHNAEKTRYVTGKRHAIQTMLTEVTSDDVMLVESEFEWIDLEDVYAALESDLAGLKARLREEGDAGSLHIRDELTIESGWWAVSVRGVGDYLEKLTAANREFLEPVLESHLSEEASDPSADAQACHVLRAACAKGWEKEHGSIFERVARDGRRSALVRSWAIAAWGRSKGWAADLAVDLGVDGESYVERRSAALSLMRHQNEGQRLRAAAHIASRHPALSPATHYVCAGPS
jgi:hypothetical protein